MTDLDTIKQIEKELNIKLGKLNQIEYGNFWFPRAGVGIQSGRASVTSTLNIF